MITLRPVWLHHLSGRTVAAIGCAVSGLVALGAPACGAASSTPRPAAGASARTAPPAATSASTPATVQVVASGLNQPKKISVAPNGSLLVALSGTGASPVSCTDNVQPSCLGQSGAIDEISPSGQVTTVVGNLPSVSSSHSSQEATGPAEARMIGGKLQVLFQDYGINFGTGRQPYGPGGALLGDLVRMSASGGSRHVEASFGPFEATNNPDHDRGTDVTRHQEPGVDSDPYSFVPYRGGYAVADAGGNDLLFLPRRGAIRLLAVFPTITERAAPGSYGTSQTRTITAQAQAVPDSVAVGPDGALYVGELGGTPFDVGTSSVYRVVPGHAPTVYARGFTSIADLAFDNHGRLLVLEIDQKGLSDPALQGSGPPSPGAIVRVGADRKHTVIASEGLEFPTGMAVTRSGVIYVSNDGITDANPGLPGSGGELVRVTLG